MLLLFFWFRESIGLVLSCCGKSCFVKKRGFFVLESCSVYLNHSVMGGFDVQLIYYLNYPRFAKITDSRGKASNAVASPITSNYIHKSTRMLG